MNLRRTAGPDPWSIGKPERKLCDGPGISCECILYIGLIGCIVKTGQHNWSVARLLYAERATSRQAYKLDRLNVMGYYKNLERRILWQQ
jgi:hypothetical protein